ncbi:hypothetical protein [Vibrio jasicida]|uniref:Uncharacterized protein n=1 Tax=Vibrio jasicida TaxID=766224 RepID=A0AAU9QWR1_9VIBR|nr:hypothetical protein [Vibrio jasicida]CAH1602511.1 conserved membrane hypothetical protein [Vibrio jasicida]CAH1603534.1 conserved membrane hypothetical protein [Vibrio jasicida]
MGLVVGGPLLIWLFCALLSIRAGFVLFAGQHFSSVLIAIALAVGVTASIIFYNWYSIAKREEVYFFSLSMELLCRPALIMPAVIAIGLYFFGGGLLLNSHIKMFVFVALFSCSVASITSLLTAEKVIDVYQIKQTY